MTNDQLKAQVMTAVEQGWPQFASEHPALARVIDQTVLNDYVADTLAGDPEFGRAYQAAVEASVGANALGTLVRHFVEIAIDKLI